MQKNQNETKGYYEARLTLTVKGEANNTASFYAELDKILDAWQDLSGDIESPLTWEDAEANLIFASKPETTN